MATYKTAGLGTYTLAGSISSTATSITLSSFTVPITGTDVTMSSLGTSTAYGTLSPGTADAEFISFTGITQNSNGTATLTGVTRGLNKETPYTTSSSFKRPHTGQALFILSNSPNVYDQFPAKVNDETITGKWTFPNDSNTPLIGSSYVAPTIDNQVATKKYADDLAIAGSPNATTSVKGIVELATQAEYDARTSTGGTGASLVPTPNLNRNVLTHDYAASSAGTDAYAITLTPAVTAYSTGDVYYFKADVANTGACSLNVNALGVKSIKIGSADPEDGVIAANALVQVQYDGTYMQLLAVSNNVTVAATAYKIARRNSTGNVTIITESTGDNTTNAASTAFVQAAIAASAITHKQSINGLVAGTPSYFAASTATGGMSTSEPLFVITSATASANGGCLVRYQKLSDGSLFASHKVSSITGTSGSTTAYCVVVGNYVYVSGNTGGTAVIKRYDKADLANETSITVSGTAFTSSMPMFSDGTNIYAVSAGAARVYTISGTTITSGASTSYTSMTASDTTWSDGTTVYQATGGTPCKWAIAGGARTAGNTLLTEQFYPAGGSTLNGIGILKDAASTSYLYAATTNTNSSNQLGAILPITSF